MLPERSKRELQQYRRVADAINFYVEKQHEQPSLGEVAAHVNLSLSHFQRIFTSWAGVSPTHFLQYLTKESAKARLQTETVQAAALSSGLSSQSRLYDLMLHWEGVTPGDCRRAGSSLTIEYGYGPTPLGLCFIALTTKGICKLAFLESGRDSATALDELKQDWPLATIRQDDEKANVFLRQIFFHWSRAGDAGQSTGIGSALRLFVKGTPFQLQVWQALLAIKPGHCWSYGDVAVYVSKPTATRAVASAIAVNPVGYLIPCHRVIRKSGALSGYRWGVERKAMLLGWEAAKS